MTAALIVLGIAVVVLLIVTLRLARRGRAAGSDAKAQAWAPSIPAPTANVAVVTRYERWMGRVELEKLGARRRDLGRPVADPAVRHLAAAG